MIVSDIAAAVREDRGVILVISDRTEHCLTLAAMLLNQHNIESSVLTGAVSGKKRRAIVDSLNNGRIKVLIATGQLIGEGFDNKELSSLFVATPVKFRGRIFQYVGRILRPAPGKQCSRVIDYIDSRVPVLLHSARARERVYLS